MIRLIHSQSLLLSDGVHDESAAITLMSTDVDIICDNILTVHEIWAQAIEDRSHDWILASFEIAWLGVCCSPSDHRS